MNRQDPVHLRVESGRFGWGQREAHRGGGRGGGGGGRSGAGAHPQRKDGGRRGGGGDGGGGGVELWLDVLLGEGLQDVVVRALERLLRGGNSGGDGNISVGILEIAPVRVIMRLLQLLELLLLENLPPLAEALGGAAGDLGGDLLPLVAVLSLERDNEGLLFGGEGALLQARLEIVLPALEAGFRIAMERLPHPLRDEIPFFGAILLDIGSKECVFFRLPPLAVLHFIATIADAVRTRSEDDQKKKKKTTKMEFILEREREF